MKEKYQKNTLGYHYLRAKAAFGKDSKAVKFLENKAKESINGFNEEVVMEESQVIMMLGYLHYKEDK